MRRLTLTFDNGPDPAATPRVLEILREHQVRAHFYVLGKHVATPEGRRLVARALDEGHVLGNHSFSHQVPLGEDPRADAVEAEIVATEELLAPLLLPGSSGASGPPGSVGPAGGSARRFRPFGGGGILGPHLLSQRAVDHLVAKRYTCVLWSSVPRDWEDPEGWPERALAECAQQSHAVLVLHDIANACAAKLGSFLGRAQQLGFELVTELPRACTPILDGEIVGDLDELVAREAQPPPLPPKRMEKLA